MRMKKDVSLNECILNARNAIIQDEELRKLLYYDVDNPLSMPDIDPLKLIEKDEKGRRFIYLQPFTQPEVVETKKTYMEIYIDNTDVRDGQAYQDIYITIAVFSHIDTYIIDDGVRALKILDRLDKLFLYGDSMKGLGKDLGKNKKITRSSPKFQGYVANYKIFTFA